MFHLERYLNRKHVICTMKEHFLIYMWHADSQSSVNSLCRIAHRQPCLVSMDDGLFSINTMLAASLSPGAIETLSGLQSFSLSQ